MDNFLEIYLKKLKNIYSNPELELRVLLNKSSHKKNETILSNFDYNDINLIEFKKNFKRRMKREPISKICNSKSFWKYDFFVNNNVLDPRPDTELILEAVLKYYPNKNQHLKILDLCTGSGCLAICLAKEYRNAKITATDISLKALEVAKINAHKLGCFSKIKFIQCDILNKISSYDIVVSNPPYLSKLEYYKTSPEIMFYEPKLALVANKDGYEFYEKISSILPMILANNSRLFLEIGSNQASKVVKIFSRNQIYCSKVLKDIQNLDRVLILNKT